MTLRKPDPLKEWEPLEVLMGMSVHDRVAYVRTNLPSPKANPVQPHMSHADFAVAVGSPNEKAPMRWEKSTTPKRFAAAIAALTPYEPAAFGADGEAELVRETLGTRLRAVEEALTALAAELHADLPKLSRRVRALERQAPPKTGRAVGS